MRTGLWNIKNKRDYPAAVPVPKKDRKLVVNIHRCPQNHSCPAVRVCPADALTQKGHKAPAIDHDECINCGRCVDTCPTGALGFV